MDGEVRENLTIHFDAGLVQAEAQQLVAISLEGSVG
jgi:hypothetical protein